MEKLKSCFMTDEERKKCEHSFSNDFEVVGMMDTPNEFEVALYCDDCGTCFDGVVSKRYPEEWKVNQDFVNEITAEINHTLRKCNL